MTIDEIDRDLLIRYIRVALDDEKAYDEEGNLKVDRRVRTENEIIEVPDYTDDGAAAVIADKVLSSLAAEQALYERVTRKLEANHAGRR